MARNTRSSARVSSNGTAGTAPPSPSSSFRGRSRGRGRGRRHTRTTRAVPRGRGPSPSSILSPPSMGPLTQSSVPTTSKVTDANNVPAVAHSSSPSTTDLPTSSSPSPLNTMPPINPVPALESTPAPAVSSLPSPSLPPARNNFVDPHPTSLKSTRGSRSAIKGPRNRVSDARVSKTVRFISKATAEIPPLEIDDNYIPEPKLSSKPDGHLYRNMPCATGYQPGTRRLIFNFESEVVGTQGALHHQALFKVGLGGGRFRPGKGTLPKRTQVVLYLKEDLNLEGIPTSIGMVFHKVKSDNFMPVITVKGDLAAVTAPLPSSSRKFDPEDPDA